MNKIIKLYKFDDPRPKDERFDIVNLKDVEHSLIEHKYYREGYYCILLLEQGEAKVEINDVELHVKAPIVLCGLPGEVWHWSNMMNLDGKFVCFEAPFILSGLRGGYSLEPISFLNSQNHYPFIPLSYTRYHKLRGLVDDMKECIGEYPVFYDLLRAELWQFIFLIEKEYILNRKQGRETEVKNHVVEFMHLVNRYYMEHHDSRFYADKLHITPNYLNKVCKTLIGINAYDYISNRIIAEAKILLRLTNINVSELAFRLGFENVNYFIKCFKKKEGVTPGEYQKMGTLAQSSEH